VRLGIFSDVHGNLPALEAVLGDLNTKGCDLIVNLGDCVTSPLWPRETFELLASRGFPTVRGNHDRWLGDEERLAKHPIVRAALSDAQRTALIDLPAALRLEPGIVAYHGRPDSDSDYLLEDKVDGRLALASAATLASRLAGVEAELVLCGHSHHQYLASTPGVQMVLNPGSVGEPRTAADVDRGIGEATSPHARYAIATRRSGRWNAELFALAYDWSLVRERATQNGYAEWGNAFR
jgi:predicted phosphodiesterase